MSNLDPDPRYVDPDDLWDPEISAWVPRQTPWPALVAGGVIGLILGLLLGVFVATRFAIAAPRAGSLPPFPAAVASQPGAPLERDARPAVPSGASAPTRHDGGAPTDEVDETAIEHGIASWYDDGPGLYGAVPSWHFGDTPYRVRVTGGSGSVVVTIRDFCGCPGARIIDLSPAAFRELASLSVGLVEVTVEDAGADRTPPATDVSQGTP